MKKTHYPRFELRLVGSYLAFAMIKFLFVVGALTLGFRNIQERAAQGQVLSVDQMANVLLSYLLVSFFAGVLIAVFGALYVSAKITDPIARIRLAMKRKLRGETQNIDCSLKESEYFADLVPLIKCLAEDGSKPVQKSSGESKAA